MQMLDRHIWRSMISVSKLRLYNVYILQVFLYGAETWSITKAIEKRIDAFDQWCLRRILKAERYLVGVCNEFRSPSAYWPATAIRYCADQTPEVVWPTSLKIIPVLYKPAYRLPQGTGGGVQVVQDIPG